MSDEIPEDLIQEIDRVLVSYDIKLYTKFLTFLANKPREDSANFIRILKHVLKNQPNHFEQTVKEMAKDAEKSLNDNVYIELMNSIWNNYIEPSDMKTQELALNLEKVIELNKCNGPVVQYNLARSLSKIPPDSLQKVIKGIEFICSKSPVLYGLSKNTIALLKDPKSNQLVNVTLLAAFLAYDVYVNLKRWWYEEISPKRCSKNIIDSISGISAGVCGGEAGLLLGAALGGAYGAVFGAFFGGIIGTQLVKTLSDWLTSKLFDVPKEEALENAFKFMKLHHSASNSEINKRFRELALSFHPDKGGKVEDFHMLQYSMGVIRLSKGYKENI